MSIEIVVVLIVSSTSFLVAIVGLVTSLVSNRQSARSEKAIETLKFELSRLVTKESISDVHLEEALKALHTTMQAIQLVKDETQIILSATDTSLDSTVALKRMEIAREKIFECYEEELASLSDGEARAVHRAKNISLLIENHIKDELLSQATASILSTEKREILALLRAELTDVQQVLRDSKTDRLLKRISNGR